MYHSISIKLENNIKKKQRSVCKLFDKPSGNIRMTWKSQAIHLNSNLLCAVDIRTSGPRPYKDDIMQICVMPLNSTFQPLEEITPFIMDILPRDKNKIDRELLEINQETFLHIFKYGLDHWTAGDSFLEWFEKINFNFQKRICPLAYDWPKIMPFIYDWLGPLNAKECFDYRYRDILSTANFLNDYYDWHIENCPFAKQNFQYICSSVQVERVKPYEPITDCLAIANVYKAMVADSILNRPFNEEKNNSEHPSSSHEEAS